MAFIQKLAVGRTAVAHLLLAYVQVGVYVEGEQLREHLGRGAGIRVGDVVAAAQTYDVLAVLQESAYSGILPLVNLLQTRFSSCVTGVENLPALQGTRGEPIESFPHFLRSLSRALTAIVPAYPLILRTAQDDHLGSAVLRHAAQVREGEWLRGPRGYGAQANVERVSVPEEQAGCRWEELHIIRFGHASSYDEGVGIAGSEVWQPAERSSAVYSGGMDVGANAWSAA